MKIAEDGKEHLFKETIDTLIKQFNLTDEEKQQLLPSGSAFVINNRYVTDIDAKIILLDGRQLTELMIENDLGVSTQDIYTIKRIDSDYFEED